MGVIRALTIGGMLLAAMMAGSMPANAAEDSYLGGALADRKAVEQRFNQGADAYDRGDYAGAYEIWLPLARDGDPAAQRNIGHLYRLGLGVAQDFVAAASWYRRAADNGLARAQANLAMMYMRGQGVDEDASEAARWFALAAIQGHAVAQYNLGLLYLRGEGVPRNEAIAAGWFYRASQAGHERAARALAALAPMLSGPAGPPPPTPAQKTALAREVPAETTAKPASEIKTEPAGAGDQPDPTAPAAPAAPAPPAADGAEKPASAEPASATPPEQPEPRNLTELIRDWLSLDDDSGVAQVRQEAGPAATVWLMPGSAEAARSDLAAATVARHSGNFAMAAKHLRPHAEAGNEEAQYRLGDLLLDGNNQERDLEHGYFWISRAALGGHAAAIERRNELDEKLPKTTLFKGSQLLKAWRDREMDRREIDTQ
jgi:TPR repeat protein